MEGLRQLKAAQFSVLLWAGGARKFGFLGFLEWVVLVK